MKLTVLGCSGSLPGPDSPAAGYLVESDGYRVVLDLGNGALGALQRYVAPRDIDAVVLSHLHADHCLDMTSLMVALRYGPDRPQARIPVIGPNDTEQRITAAWDADTADLRLRELFDFHLPVSGNLGPFKVEFAPMNHPVPTFAVRMTLGAGASCTPVTPVNAMRSCGSPRARTRCSPKRRSVRAIHTCPTCI